MPTYIVYVETLDLVTHKISLDWTPIGMVYALGINEARELARLNFQLRGNQRPHWAIDIIAAHFEEPIEQQVANDLRQRLAQAEQRAKDAENLLDAGLEEQAALRIRNERNTQQIAGLELAKTVVSNQWRKSDELAIPASKIH